MISFTVLLLASLLAIPISAQAPPNADLSKFNNQLKVHAEYIDALAEAADANECRLPNNLFNLASQTTGALDAIGSLQRLNNEAAALPDELNQNDLKKIAASISNPLATYYEQLSATLIEHENCYPVGPVSKAFISGGLKTLNDGIFKLQNALYEKAGIMADNPGADATEDACNRIRAALKKALDAFAT